jgi:hypothetical protein
MRRLLQASILLASLAAAAVPAADDLHGKLGKGEVVVDVEPGGAVPLVTMQGVVDAPPEVVWDVVSHCGLYRGRLPRVAESEELPPDGDHVRCRTVVETPWPWKPLTSITRALHTVRPGVWKREWALESGDYITNEGSWTLTPFDAAATRTLVVYRLRAQVNMSVPLIMQEIAEKQALPETLAAVRRVVAGLAKPR